MKKVIMIDEDVVNDIQAKDVEVQSSRAVIAQVLDAHSLDTDTSFIESPIFRAYEEASTKKKIAFERAKDKMAAENIPADLKGQVKGWDLNYFTNELTITY